MGDGDKRETRGESISGGSLEKSECGDSLAWGMEEESW